MPLGETRRRQSRTAHGRTRHEGRPPGPPAYPPLSSRRSLWRRRHFEAEAIFDHRGRIAPPTPGALCSRSGVACQEGRQNFIARRRIRRPRAAERPPQYSLSGLYDLRILKKKPVQARPRPRPSTHQSLLSRMAKAAAHPRAARGNAPGDRQCGGFAVPASGSLFRLGSLNPTPISTKQATSRLRPAPSAKYT